MIDIIFGRFSPLAHISPYILAEEAGAMARAPQTDPRHSADHKTIQFHHRKAPDMIREQSEAATASIYGDICPRGENLRNIGSIKVRLQLYIIFNN